MNVDTEQRTRTYVMNTVNIVRPFLLCFDMESCATPVNVVARMLLLASTAQQNVGRYDCITEIYGCMLHVFCSGSVVSKTHWSVAE